MLKNALFVYNSIAGSQGVQSRLDHIVKRFLDQGILLHILPAAEASEDILSALLEEQNFRYDFVVLSGGDGTLNHFVTLMMNNGVKTPLGILPYGTCNDFARCLHIPQDLDICLDIILKGRKKRVDIGRMNEKRYFLSTCAGGRFVDVPMKTPPVYKRNFGPLAYYFHGLSELTNIRPFDLTIQTDQMELKENILLFLFLNGNHAAGFENLLDTADLSDGRMDLILIKECSYFDLANLFVRLFSKDLPSDPHVIHITVEHCTIEGSKNMCLTMDGEDGGALPLTVSVLPQAMEVFVP